MNADMAQAFLTGAGVDPAVMKTTITVIVVGVGSLAIAWMFVKLMEAHGDDSLSTAEVVFTWVRLAVLCVLFLYVVL